ncbi:transcriptional regulator [Acuticoccus sediminis]|uniref:Transcriptional regulator n=1 Tax=Acuticoccus sediminis TaxID=2184697 RepID=A0A8B2P035_9HYPH|nr:helix-turn-helix domain-containing protein [Acuticoccus sediminis]RAI03825.1 transcriptional regulator [Acuticoccus sediminis]
MIASLSTHPASHSAFSSHATPLTRVGSHEHIFHEGAPAEAMFMIVNGVVVIYRTGIDGCRIIQDLRFKGEYVGVGYEENYSFSAIAVRPTVVRRIARAAVERAIDESPVTARRLLEALTLEQSRLSDRLMVIGSRTAIGRVAACFLDISSRSSGGAETFMVPISRSEMADYLGLTIETVSRAITRLRTLGIIALPRSDTVTIRDRAALQALAQDDGDGAARGRFCA